MKFLRFLLGCFLIFLGGIKILFPSPIQSGSILSLAVSIIEVGLGGALVLSSKPQRLRLIFAASLLFSFVLSVNQVLRPARGCGCFGALRFLEDYKGVVIAFLGISSLCGYLISTFPTKPRRGEGMNLV